MVLYAIISIAILFQCPATAQLAEVADLNLPDLTLEIRAFNQEIQDDDQDIETNLARVDANVDMLRFRQMKRQYPIGETQEDDSDDPADKIKNKNNKSADDSSKTDETDDVTDDDDKKSNDSKNSEFEDKNSDFGEKNSDLDDKKNSAEAPAQDDVKSEDGTPPPPPPKGSGQPPGLPSLPDPMGVLKPLFTAATKAATAADKALDPLRKKAELNKWKPNEEDEKEDKKEDEDDMDEEDDKPPNPNEPLDETSDNENPKEGTEIPQNANSVVPTDATSNDMSSERGILSPEAEAKREAEIQASIRANELTAKEEEEKQIESLRARIDQNRAEKATQSEVDKEIRQAKDRMKAKGAEEESKQRKKERVEEAKPTTYATESKKKSEVPPTDTKLNPSIKEAEGDDRKEIEADEKEEKEEDTTLEEEPIAPPPIPQEQREIMQQEMLTAMETRGAGREATTAEQLIGFALIPGDGVLEKQENSKKSPKKRHSKKRNRRNAILAPRPNISVQTNNVREEDSPGTASQTEAKVPWRYENRPAMPFPSLESEKREVKVCESFLALKGCRDAHLESGYYNTHIYRPKYVQSLSIPIGKPAICSGSKCNVTKAANTRQLIEKKLSKDARSLDEEKRVVGEMEAMLRIYKSKLRKAKDMVRSHEIRFRSKTEQSLRAFG